MATATITEDLMTIGDLLDQLGGISASRVRLRPFPGTATEADLIRTNDHGHAICELVGGVLVEKPMGKLESLLAGMILTLLNGFVIPRKLGFVTGEAGMMRLAPGLSRAPDVSFISWARIPAGPLTEKSLADVVPDLAVEVLSRSNTKKEMARKRREYFEAGVRLVWEVDPKKRTVAVYVTPENPTVLDASQTLDGGDVLPGFELRLADLFAELDRNGA